VMVVDGTRVHNGASLAGSPSVFYPLANFSC